MILLYYEIMFALSVILTIVYVFMWHRHFDINLTILFTLIPITNLGYLLIAQSESLEAALTANTFTYIGGCFLPLFIALSVFGLCRINLPKTAKCFMIAFSSMIFAVQLTAGRSDIFFKSVSFEKTDDAVRLIKEYGPFHSVFIAMVIVYFCMSLVGLKTGLSKKDVSNKITVLLVLPELISAFSFFFGRKLISSVDITPLSFMIAQIFYLLIVYRICLYNVDDTVIDSLVGNGETGFISFDSDFNYLGSNETAKNIFPELHELIVDENIENSEKLKNTVLKWLTEFRDDNSRDSFYYESESCIYLADIQFLYDGSRKRGYYIFLKDDTANRNYISLLSNYNSDLKVEIAEKTNHIVEMNDNLIMSMAAMVESRDNSTGGHIKRTGEVVRILVDEMYKDNEFGLSWDYFRRIIKAAPMHDLGKIAVDDAVLRKPGRFTDEEFEKMKAHAAEGARIVHEILKGTDDPEFARIAENVAHYHHERWDGSGYPEGLKGEEIPLEARIMAVADVYDALVSKRVYKESMSFEKADSIIMDGMGKHFDKRLEKYYVRARERLENFYRTSAQ